MQKIRIIETTTYEYVPDLNEKFYAERNIMDIQGAFDVDFDWVSTEGGDLVEVVGEEYESKTRKWQIINEDGDVIYEETERDN